MNRQILMIGLVLLCLAVALGCGDDNGTDSKVNPIPSELVANWTLTSGAVNGVPVPLTTMLGWESNTTHALLVVATGGTYSYFEKDADSRLCGRTQGRSKSVVQTSP